MKMNDKANLLNELKALKEQNEALKESNDKLLHLASNIPSNIAYVNANTLKYEFVNDAFEKSFGIKKEKIVGSHIKEIIGENNYLFALKYINEVRSGKSISYENSFELVSGKRWIQVNYSPVFGTDGTVSSIAVLSYDITELKRSEEALREQEELFKSVVHNSSELTILTDEKGIVTYVSPQCETILGYKEAEFIGSVMPDIIYPEDITKCKNMWEQVFGNGIDLSEFEYRIIDRNDKVRWISHSAKLVKINEKVFGMQNTIHNITERKLIEETQLFLLGRNNSIGEENFFEPLAQYLAKTLQMDYVCIDKLHGDLLSAQTVAIYFDGKFEENVEYTLKETPCGDVVGKTICCFPEGVRHLFPNDFVLQEMAAESYVGTTLFSTIGEPIGLIALIGRKPMNNRNLAETILKFVAIRTAGELERMQAEEALKESEEKFRNLFNNSEVGMYRTRLDGSEILEFNEKYLNILNYTREEVIGNPSRNLWADKSERDRMVKTLKSEGKVTDFECDLLNKQGKALRCITSLRLYGDEGILEGSIQDITERKEAEEALRESEERYTLTLNALNDGLWDWNVSTGNAFFTPQYYSLLEYDNCEFPATYASWLLMVHPDDLNRVEEELRHSIEYGKGFNINLRMSLKSGGWKWVATRGKVVENDADGKALRMVGVLTDITERKEAEEKLSRSEKELKRAQQITHIGSWYLDIATNKVVWSEELYKMYGFDPALPPPPYTEHQKLFTPESWELLSSSLANTIDTGIPYEIVLKTVKDDGRNGWMWARGETIKDQNGKTIGLWGAAQDITERKEVEEKLIGSENKFRALISEMQLGLAVHEIICDENGLPINYRFLDVNPSFEKLTGLKREMVVGKKVLDIMPNTEMEWINKYGHVALTGETLVYENYSSELGKYYSVIAYRNRQNEFAVIIEDITERKEAEERLKESEQRFAQLAEQSSTFTWEINSEGLFTFITPVIEQVLGYSPSEIINKMHFYDLQPEEDVDGIKEAVLGIFTRKEPMLNINHRSQTKTGEIVWINTNGMPIIGKDGVLLGYNGNDTDITGRKQAEERIEAEKRLLSAIIDNIPDQIYYKDIESRFVLCNPAVAFNCGMNKVEEVVGKTDFDLFPQEHAKQYFEDEQTLIKSGKPLINHEEIVKNIVTGEIHWSLSTKVPIVDSVGNVTGLVGINRDISERKQADYELALYRNHLEDLVKTRTEELNKVNKALEREIEKDKEFELMLQKSLQKEKELNEMKSRFITTTSHEFRTPLTALSLSADLIKRYGSNWSEEKRNEHLDKIKKAVKYLTTLLEDILALNRVETGEISYKPEQVDLHRFAQECIEDTKSGMNNSHQLKFGFQSEVKDFYLDPKLMRFILSNLLSNAAKYSPAGGKIELDISSNLKYLTINISDEGIGIKANEIANVFDSFYRAQNAEDMPGTGLGLAIAKRAVELHSGEITVRSELNKGTTFTVKIPNVIH